MAVGQKIFELDEIRKTIHALKMMVSCLRFVAWKQMERG